MKKYVFGMMLAAALLGMPVLRAADLATGKDSYPLTTCVVSGDKLGEMEAPVIYHHQGKEVRFCCKECLPKFKADPEKYLKKIEDARAKVGTKN